MYLAFVLGAASLDVEFESFVGQDGVDILGSSRGRGRRSRSG